MWVIILHLPHLSEGLYRATLVCMWSRAVEKVKFRSGLITGALLLISSSLSCQGVTADFTGLACPCGEGWVCDSQREICVPVGKSGGGNGGDSKSGAGDTMTSGDDAVSGGDDSISGGDDASPGGDSGPTVGFGYTPMDLPHSLLPVGDVSVNCDATFNTDTGWFVEGSGCVTGFHHNAHSLYPSDDSAIVAVHSLDIAAGARLSHTGWRAVSWVVFGDARIAGTLDVSAEGSNPPPGRRPLQGCGTARGQAGESGGDNGAGGGGGGAFVGGGGAGETGDSWYDGGVGGTAISGFPLAVRRGGCQGGKGGSSGGGEGGSGGGAIQLSVAGTLNIVGGGFVASAGGGGRGGNDECGGGGGGSGGLVRVEAGVLEIAEGGGVTANGGGGAAGRRDEDGLSDPGDDGSKISSVRAVGGDGSNGDAAGGPGGAGSDLGGGNGDPDSEDAGGGGGGGVGQIVLRSPSCKIDDLAVVSPPVSCVAP